MLCMWFVYLGLIVVIALLFCSVCVCYLHL